MMMPRGRHLGRHFITRLLGLARILMGLAVFFVICFFSLLRMGHGRIVIDEIWWFVQRRGRARRNPRAVRPNEIKNTYKGALHSLGRTACLPALHTRGFALVPGRIKSAYLHLPSWRQGPGTDAVCGFSGLAVGSKKSSPSRSAAAPIRGQS